MTKNSLGKKKSKRVNLADKYRAKKHVKEHLRKERRAARKNPKRNALKKDPGIPNLFPFKQDLLRQMETKRERDRALEEERKELRKQVVELRRAGYTGSLEEMQQEAARRAEAFDEDNDDADAMDEDEQMATDRYDRIKGRSDNSRRAYYREFHKVVENSDVILEVLDARDPLGCRARDVERAILQKDATKRIILVLNKIDLVPRETVDRWLSFLRREYPCVAFKASTQTQRANLAQSKVSVTAASAELLQTNQCLGADCLMQILKNYARNKNIKTGVRCGVIGYPNVGKSSLINSLKRARVVNVGSTPGLTKNAQEIHLDKQVKLFDCPGIVFASGKVDADIILRNAVKVEQLEDPVTPIESIVRRCRIDQLVELYRIARFRDANEFLFRVAQKQGKLKRGGIPDLESAARGVLKDWNSGRIPFFTEPPEDERKIHVSAEIVQAWSKEFDIDTDEVKATEKHDLDMLEESAVPKTFVAMQPGESGGAQAQFIGDDGMMDEGDDDDDDDEAPQLVGGPAARTIVPADGLVPQSNKDLKKLQKKNKKDIRRGKIMPSAPASVADDAYDFAADYVPKAGDVAYAMDEGDDDDDDDDRMFDDDDDDDDDDDGDEDM